MHCNILPHPKKIGHAIIPPHPNSRVIIPSSPPLCQTTLSRRGLTERRKATALLPFLSQTPFRNYRGTLLSQTHMCTLCAGVVSLLEPDSTCDTWAEVFADGRSNDVCFLSRSATSQHFPPPAFVRPDTAKKTSFANAKASSEIGKVET